MISTLSKLKAYFTVYFLKGFKLLYVLIILKKSYKTIPTYSISKQYRADQAPINPDLIYGELAIADFLYVLALIPKKKNCKLYDLGCGDGRLLLAAVLFFKNVNAIGIEKVPALQQVAAEVAVEVALSRFSKLLSINQNDSDLKIIESSFLSYDFSDADVVYINGVALTVGTWDDLQVCFKKLNKGSYVISVERKLDDKLFDLIYIGRHDASWGKAWIYMYRRRSALK